MPARRFAGNYAALSGAPVSSAWTPTSLTTAPIAWASGKDATGATGASVGALSARAGPAYTQATGANKPTRATFGNGLGLQFNGTSSDLHASSSIVHGSDWFVIAIAHVLSSDNKTIVGADDFTNRQAQYLNMATGQGGLASLGFDTTATPGTPTFAACPATQPSDIMVAAKMASKVLTPMVNTSSTSATTSTLTGTGAAKTMGLWLGQVGGSANYFDGILGEFVLLAYAPNASDQAKIEGYLAWEWGLQSLLPVGHTYKSSAP